jgi:hypothetical protein
MDRNLKDKMQTPAETEAEVCQYCGQPADPRRCRRVPDGWFCWANGLKLDYARLGLVDDPAKAIIEETRAVKKAREGHERAVAESEQADAAWKAAAVAHHKAKQLRYAEGQTVYTPQGASVEIAPEGATDADLRQTQDIASQAFALRESAAEEVIRARLRLEAA